MGDTTRWVSGRGFPRWGSEWRSPKEGPPGWSSIVVPKGGQQGGVPQAGSSMGQSSGSRKGDATRQITQGEVTPGGSPNWGPARSPAGGRPRDVHQVKYFNGVPTSELPNGVPPSRTPQRGVSKGVSNGITRVESHKRGPQWRSLKWGRVKDSPKLCPPRVVGQGFTQGRTPTGFAKRVQQPGPPRWSHNLGPPRRVLQGVPHADPRNGVP
jgi:hypothetical protein